MNNQFDELTKSLAQTVTRRAALQKLGTGLVAALAAALGIRTANAAPKRHGYCAVIAPGFDLRPWYSGQCVDPVTCQSGPSSCGGKVNYSPLTDACGFRLDRGKGCTF